MTIVGVSFVIGACSHNGFNRGELKEQIGVQTPVYNDDAIKDVFSKQSNLPKPFKLAVYFKTPKKIGRDGAEWRWTEIDKLFFEELARDLKSKEVVSDVFPLINPVVIDEDLKSLRLAAARHHADALLVVGGAGETDRSINKWGWSYALILPTLFVPGSQADTLFMTHATLWDVRNEYLYLTAEAEASTRETYVAAFGKQNKELLDEAKTASLQNLKTELKKMMDGVRL